MKHLPRSSPHLVHDETKSFGSIPSPRPAAQDETVLDQHLYQLYPLSTDQLSKVTLVMAVNFNMGSDQHTKVNIMKIIMKMINL